MWIWLCVCIYIYMDIYIYIYIYIYISYNKKVVYVCVTPHETIRNDCSDINTKRWYILLKQRYWISKSFTIIIYLKIESYIELKIHNVLMPVVHLMHVTSEMIKSLQYIYNKGLRSYIKMLLKIKNNPWTMMVYGYN